MICGTNPTHIFELPFDTAMVKSAQVIYAQRNQEVVRKETSDCTMEDSMIGVALTQEETLSFDPKHNVQIQLKVLTIDDVAYVSPIYVVNAGECLMNEVIT